MTMSGGKIAVCRKYTHENLIGETLKFLISLAPWEDKDSQTQVQPEHLINFTRPCLKNKTLK